MPESGKCRRYSAQQGSREISQPESERDAEMLRTPRQTAGENLLPAVFLDRDGAVNEEVDYLGAIEQFEFIAGSVEAIRLLNDAGLKTIIITNQAGVARGLYDEKRLRQIHYYMEEELRKQGARLDGVYYCPHHPTAGLGAYKIDCACRKPRPGMLKQAARDLKIDLQKSFVVGDKLSDLQAGRAVHCKTVLVRTGYGQNTENELPGEDFQPDHIADNLLTAVRWLLAQRAK